MADSSVLEALKTSVPCRFFVNGICRQGDRCKYLHQDSMTQVSSDSDESVTIMKKKVKQCPRINASKNDEGCSGTSGSYSFIDPNSCGIDDTNNTSLGQSREAEACDTSTVNGSSLRGSQSNSEPAICQYFQQGCCMFGSNCFNRHDIDESSSSSSKSSNLSDEQSNNKVISSDDPSTSDFGPTSVSSFTEDTKDEANQGCIERLATIQLKTKLRVNAPEFIPSGFTSAPPDAVTENEVKDSEESQSTNSSSGKTWAQVVNASAGNGTPSPFTSLCPYAQAGDCPYADECTYIHGNICEFCGSACLHPTNEQQRKSHTDECIKQHEREMELAFAVARSKDKQCGVCFEVVVDKNPASEQRFGILPNCNHCFCLACIRKWRQAKQFENKIIRLLLKGMSECRVTSDFVCPSTYWVDTKEEKEKLILTYKDALSNKQCKYFKQGRGKCPFGNKCFYLHAYPDGTKVDTGPPLRRPRQSADGETDVVELFLWDFLDARDNSWRPLDELEAMDFADELDAIHALDFSGSDYSDTSDELV